MLRTVLRRVSILILISAALVGCAGARPWERESLAKRKMQFNEDPEAIQFEQHVYQYREGTTGGYGSSGGGCGCN